MLKSNFPYIDIKININYIFLSFSVLLNRYYTYDWKLNFLTIVVSKENTFEKKN